MNLYIKDLEHDEPISNMIRAKLTESIELNLYSSSVSTFVLSQNLSLLDLICSELFGNALRARNWDFSHFFDGQKLTVFTFCPFLTRSSCLGLFYHFESTKVH